MSAEQLRELQEKIREDTQSLPLHATKMVPGEGPYNSQIMFVGEALGATEQEKGRPFVGDAGKLLNEILEKSGINREEIYITNVVKARPSDNGTKNRAPNVTEIAAHEMWLWKEIELIKPKIIVTLGRIASRVLLKNNKLIMGKVVGQTFTEGFSDIIIIPCWHPSYLMTYGPSKINDEIQYFRKAKRLQHLRKLWKPETVSSKEWHVS